MYVYVCVCVCEPVNLLIVRNVNSKATLNPLSCFFFSLSPQTSAYGATREKGDGWHFVFPPWPLGPLKPEKVGRDTVESTFSSQSRSQVDTYEIMFPPLPVFAAH